MAATSISFVKIILYISQAGTVQINRFFPPVSYFKCLSEISIEKYDKQIRHSSSPLHSRIYILFITGILQILDPVLTKNLFLQTVIER